MSNHISELFLESKTIKKIQDKLPKLFLLAELESQRAGKVGMEVGSLRERVLVSLLIYKFGEKNVEINIPITESEVDVRLFNNPISIKTKTGTSYTGVKLIWTVDAQNAKEFRDSYSPSCDIIFAQIFWNNLGGLYYIPLEAQSETFHKIGKKQYIKLPSLGTNPRGVEISSNGLERIINHQKTLKIDINWKREEIQYNPYKRWVDLWHQD